MLTERGLCEGLCPQAGVGVYEGVIVMHYTAGSKALESEAGSKLQIRISVHLFSDSDATSSFVFFVCLLFVFFCQVRRRELLG